MDTIDDRDSNVLQEVPTSPRPRVAAEGAQAVADTAPWLHRRVERVTYKEQLVVRRAISVDFTIPEEFPPFEELPDGHNTYYVPISLLRKWPPLFRLDVRSEEGHPIPLLSSRKNQEVDAAVLAALAPDGPLKQLILPTILGITAGPRHACEEAHDRLGAEIIQRRPRLPEAELRAWINVVVLGGDLVNNSILWVRVRARPRQRQVIKFAYDEPFDVPLGGVRGIIRSLGWVPYRQQLTLPHLGDGGSFHLQFEAPEGLTIQNITFRIRHPWETEGQPPPQRLRRLRGAGRQVFDGLRRGLRAKLQIVWPRLTRRPVMTHEPDPPQGEPFTWNAGDRAYLYISGRRKHWGVGKFDLALDDRTFPTAALAVSLATAILLTLVTTTAAAVVDEPRFAPAITVLLLVPALLGFLIVRPAEHPLVTVHLTGVRWAVFFAASLPVVAAVGMLFAGPDNPDGVTPLWTGLTVTAWVLVAVLLLSWMLPGRAYGPDPGR